MAGYNNRRNQPQKNCPEAGLEIGRRAQPAFGEDGIKGVGMDDATRCGHVHRSRFQIESGCRRQNEHRRPLESAVDFATTFRRGGKREHLRKSILGQEGLRPLTYIVDQHLSARINRNTRPPLDASLHSSQLHIFTGNNRDVIGRHIEAPHGYPKREGRQEPVMHAHNQRHSTDDTIGIPVRGDVSNTAGSRREVGFGHEEASGHKKRGIIFAHLPRQAFIAQKIGQHLLGALECGGVHFRMLKRRVKLEPDRQVDILSVRHGFHQTEIARGGRNAEYDVERNRLGTSGGQDFDHESMHRPIPRPAAELGDTRIVAVDQNQSGIAA